MDSWLIIGIIVVFVLMGFPVLIKLFGVADYSHLRGTGIHADRMNLRDMLQGQMTDYRSVGKSLLLHELSVYVFGDNRYDESFSIETKTDGFFGECGISISKTIDVGEPKKVTTFEIWLFDAKEMETFTKVLMSQHIFSDSFARHELSPEVGEPILVEYGASLKIESARVHLEARILKADYVEDAMLPAQSYFQHLGIEIAAWEK